jgi:hypothetical protein
VNKNGNYPDLKKWVCAVGELMRSRYLKIFISSL